jgi:hypothetical protein
MKWITRLTIIAVFVLGGVSGVMVGMRLEREKLLTMERSSPSTLTERALEQISSEVKLDPGQKERLRGILKSVQPAIAAAENERRRKVIIVMETVRASALTLMDSSQKIRYDALHDRIKKRLAPLAGEVAAAATFMGWL